MTSISFPLTSHRLALRHISQMLVGDDGLREMIVEESRDVKRAFDARRASLERAATFDKLIRLSERALGTGRSRLPYTILARSRCWRRRHPRRTARILKALRRPCTETRQKQVCLVSRQRLIGHTNGSSNYLLQICAALRDNGYAITLVSPNPGTFGRMPFLFLRPEMSVFDKIFILAELGGSGGGSTSRKTLAWLSRPPNLSLRSCCAGRG